MEKGRCGRWSAAELGMGLDWGIRFGEEEGGANFYSQPTSILGQSAVY